MRGPSRRKTADQLSLNVDAFPRAFFGGLDNCIKLTVGEIRESFSASWIRHNIAVFDYVGQPIVEEGKYVRRYLFTETVARTQILVNPDLHVGAFLLRARQLGGSTGKPHLGSSGVITNLP